MEIIFENNQHGSSLHPMFRLLAFPDNEAEVSEPISSNIHANQARSLMGGSCWERLTSQDVLVQLHWWNKTGRDVSENCSTNPRTLGWVGLTPPPCDLYSSLPQLLTAMVLGELSLLSLFDALLIFHY